MQLYGDEREEEAEAEAEEEWRSDELAAAGGAAAVGALSAAGRTA